MNRKTLLRIIVSVLIVWAIAAIWMLKNQPTSLDSQGIVQSADASDSTTEQGEVPVDFELETDAVDLEALTAYSLPVIIDFGSDSCIPCKEMAPVLQSMNTEMQKKAIIKFVDVWKNANAADGFPVQVIPTQVLINADGTPYVPSDEVAQQIELTMYNYKETDEHAFTVHQGGMTEEQMRLILADMGVGE